MLKLKKLLLATLLSSATLFAGFTTVDCTNQTHLDTLKLPQIECEVLEALWDATDGANWIDNTGWDELQDVKDWKGIETFTEHPTYTPVNNSSVLGILLKNNGLKGELPEALGDLIAPIQLSFGNNNLYGTIPGSIKNLTHMGAFAVYGNSLSGALPDFSQMPDLVYVSIERNAFTFSEIEPQIDIFSSLTHTFADAPQAEIDESTHKVEYFNENIPLSITPSLAINPSGNDQYEWRHAVNTTDIAQSLDYNQSRVYTKLQPTQEDAGYYSYKVANSEVSYIGQPHEGYKRLLLYSTKYANAIHAVYNHIPSVSKVPDALEEISVGNTYTYTPAANDADQDSLSFSIVDKPLWLTFETATGELSATPTQSNIGDHNISIRVSDGKQTLDINYTLRVLPQDVEPQTPVAPVNRSYQHSDTDNTIATALTSPQLHLYFDGINGRAVFIEDNVCSANTYHAYIGFPYSGGKLYTGYLKCGVTQDFKSTIEDNAYPNGTTATLLPEPNTNKAMIMVEIPLGTASITIGE